MNRETATQEAVGAIIKEAIQAAGANERPTNQMGIVREPLNVARSVREEKAANQRQKKQECQEAANFQAIYVAAERTNRQMGQSLAGSSPHIRTSMEKAIFNRHMKTMLEDPKDEHWDELAALYKSLSDYAHVFPKVSFMLMNYYYAEWKETQDLASSEGRAKVDLFFERQFHPTPSGPGRAFTDPDGHLWSAWSN